VTDNALDACEAAGVAPRIKIELGQDHISVADNGGGISPETIDRIVDYGFKTSSNAAYRSPTRGAQGNALQTLLAMAHALTGRPGVTVIESRGIRHRITFSIDPISREPRLDVERAEIPAAPGTMISVLLPTTPDVRDYLHNIACDFTWTNPHLTVAFVDRVRGTSFENEATDHAWQKWKPTDPTSAHWYDLEALKGLIAADVNRSRRNGSAQRSVRDFIADFRGLAGTVKRRQICETISASREPLDTYFDRGDDAVNRLLKEMKAASKPVKPRDLGVIGEEHILASLGGDPECSLYKRVEIDVGGVPYLIECAFGYRQGASHRTMITGLNWSAAVAGNPFQSALNLGALLVDQRCGEDEPIAFFLHVASPCLAFLDRGKKSVALPIEVNKAVESAIRTVTAAWCKQRKAEERDRRARLRRDDAMMAVSKPLSIRDAAFSVMTKAYAAASDNGALPANARQIFYAARGEIMRLAEVDVVDSGRFTQEFLIDYMHDHPEECAGWNVVFSDRGHFVEPHTSRTVGIGTLAVREYLRGYGKPALIPGSFTDPRIETHGPEGRFGGLLYIEKEGFEPLLNQARIGRRFDLAIMSCKGMSVTAARELVDQTCARFKVPLYILRDFDIAGFSIARTIHQTNRRYEFKTRSGDDFKVIDFGLRLADIERLDLGSERVDISRNGGEALRNRLEINGATNEEIDFLLSGRRVELNAMTSRQFINFLEEKLAAHGAGKVVPTSDQLADAYRLFFRGKRAREVAERALAALPTEECSAPADLEERVRAYLEENPEAAWDDAVTALAPNTARADL
jgi:DNA topoisomerase VI subunit B